MAEPLRGVRALPLVSAGPARRVFEVTSCKSLNSHSGRKPRPPSDPLDMATNLKLVELLVANGLCLPPEIHFKEVVVAFAQKEQGATRAAR